MKEQKKSDWIVCLGGQDWWYHSHAYFGIQMMKQFSKRTNVLFVCSIGMRMPSFRNDSLFWPRIKRKLKSVSRMVRCVSPQLYVYSPLPLPLYQYSWGRALNTFLLRFQLRAIYLYLGIKSPLVWVNTPTAWPVISTFPKRGLVYQRTDAFAAYDFDNFNSEYIKTIDFDLKSTSDLVLHVSKELFQNSLEINPKSILLTQGVDKAFFKYSGNLPTDLKSIPRPLVGYIGGMDSHKFNSDLLLEVATNLPNHSFVLVGPPSSNIEELQKLPNVHLLGIKKHDEIPSYVHSFDLCILPTARTEWGLKCRPIKLMEYLAANKPVLATQTPASEQFLENIFISNDGEEWCEEIQRLTVPDGKSQSPVNTPKDLKSWDDHSEQLWNRLNKENLV